MNLGLKGKIALVTASSEGLGKASAFALAQEGATVILCARRESLLQQTAEEIRSATGATIDAVRANVSDKQDIEQLVRYVLAKYKSIHVLVHNAGGPPAGNLETLPDTEWQHAHELTLMSFVRMTKAVLPEMKQQQWGRIITINSIVAKQPINELLLSSTIRPGILGFIKIMANQYARYNITFNAVCPGNILTKRQHEIARASAQKQGITYEQYLQQVASAIPAQRLGKPEEIGSVVAFLASEQAGYINGTSVFVDGGALKAL